MNLKRMFLGYAVFFVIVTILMIIVSIQMSGAEVGEIVNFGFFEMKKAAHFMIIAFSLIALFISGVVINVLMYFREAKKESENNVNIEQG